MLRIAVASYLMMVTAAGPWFCCCAPVRLAAALAHPRVEQPAPEVCPDCCKHHDQQGSRTPPADEPVKSPTRPGCPCRGEPNQTVALPPTAEGSKSLPITDLSERLTAAAPFIVVDTSGPPCSSVLLLGARRAHPFLTAEDILRTLHHLRC